MRLLLLSINNTRTRLVKVVDAFWEEEEGVWEVGPIWLGPTADFNPGLLAQFLTENRLSALDGVVISSVVPAVEAALQEVLAPYHCVRVSAEAQLNFSLADYPGRATLGADRIADLAAAAENYALPAVILDLGTAVTVDVLDAEHRYRGGLIAPGLRMFTDYLADRTAQLPRVETPIITAPPALGQDTEGAIAAGAFYGFAGQCQGLLEAAMATLPQGRAQSIIVTGGDAAVFHKSLAAPGIDIHHAPELALTGMRLLGRLNIPTP